MATCVTAFEYVGFATNIRFGAGTAAELDSDLALLGCSRPLLIGAAADIVRWEASLDQDRPSASAPRFDVSRQHVPEDLANAAVHQALETEADALVTIGGGSATGVGKVVKLRRGLPLVAVPTTYAGSEMTPIYGLTANGVKVTHRDERVVPDLVIYDPALTLSLPLALSTTSALNAIAHCVEALYAPGANPITALHACRGATTMLGALRGLQTDLGDMSCRETALYAACLSGLALAVAGTSTHHKLCHILGGAFDLPHAETHAVLLPYVVAYLRPAVSSALAPLSAASTEPLEHVLRNMALMGGAPQSLAELGLDADDLPRAAELCASTFASSPRPGGVRESARLLELAHAGAAVGDAAGT
jgi:maleylacetate reductase